MDKRSTAGRCRWIDPQCKCEWRLSIVYCRETFRLKEAVNGRKGDRLTDTTAGDGGETSCKAVEEIDAVVIECSDSVEWIIGGKGGIVEDLAR